MNDTNICRPSECGNGAQLHSHALRDSYKSSFVRYGLAGLAVAGFAVPVVTYFWFIHHYAVNVVWIDQWSNVDLLARSHAGTLNLSVLWAQHLENRMFFPNLIVLLLARTTHFNILIEEYLSAAILIVAVFLVVLAHRRRSSSIPLVFYCPLAIVVLSFVQWANALWGFQIAWYLIILALAVSLFLLDSPKFSRWLLAGAALAAIVGSFSSFGGLLIWPAGLFLLFCRRRPRSAVLAWISCAIATALVYFYHLNLSDSGTNNSYAFTHPITTIRSFFYTVGDVVGLWSSDTPISFTHVAANWAVVALGVVIFTIAIWIVIVNLRVRDARGGGPVGASLIVFGLLFAATFTAGRASFGNADAYRFATYGVLILVGCYLAILDPPLTLKKRSTAAKQSFDHEEDLIRSPLAKGLLYQRVARTQGQRGADVSIVVMQSVLAVVIFLQISLGTYNGLAAARGWHQHEVVTADVTVNIDKASDTLVANVFWPYGTGAIRRLVHISRTLRLDLFATGESVFYLKEGLHANHLPVPLIRVIHPAIGATVNGRLWLLATTSPLARPNRVEFHLTGGGLQGAVIAVAKMSRNGWTDLWNSTAVPNGNYVLQSVGYNVSGKSTQSRGILIRVKN
jgi:hypothetical protein